jgi:hypothetical protein
MDISMCFGNNCPIKKDCKRFNNNSVQVYQWYSDFKGEIKDGKFVCDSYIELLVSNKNENQKNQKNQ